MEFNDPLSSSLIYLDYNATTPLADEVVKGISNSLNRDWGNPSSNNQYGCKAKSVIQEARNQIANMVQCSPENVIFTSGGTEANNMIINSALHYFEKFKKDNSLGSDLKPHIITTNVEHDSVILPIRNLEKRGLITCSVVEVNANGCLNIEDVISEIKDETCLITIMYANNETGVIMPIFDLGNKLSLINSNRSSKNLVKILFHTDAAQIIGKDFVNFQACKVDYMTIVGHKFYGPRIGCICAKTSIFPLMFGGGQENGIRPGTENTPMIVGLGIAADLVNDNLINYREHMLMCRNKLETALREAFGNEIVVNCKESPRLPNTLNISFKESGLEGSLILSRCNSLIASVGAACHGENCSQVLVNSGVPLELAKNAIRLSLGRTTTYEEISQAVSDLKLAVDKLKTR